MTVVKLPDTGTERAGAEYRYLRHVLAPEVTSGPHYLRAVDRMLAEAADLVARGDAAGASDRLAAARQVADRFGASIPEPLRRRLVPAELLRPGDLVIGWQRQRCARPVEMACEVARVEHLGDVVRLTIPTAPGRPVQVLPAAAPVAVFDELL